MRQQRQGNKDLPGNPCRATAKRPERARWSKQLLQQREIEKRLAKSGEYDKAIRAKRVADEMEKREMEATMEAFEQELAMKEAKVVQRQKQELEALEQRGKRGKQELLTARKLDRGEPRSCSMKQSQTCLLCASLPLSKSHGLTAGTLLARREAGETVPQHQGRAHQHAAPRGGAARDFPRATGHRGEERPARDNPQELSEGRVDLEDVGTRQHDEPQGLQDRAAEVKRRVAGGGGGAGEGRRRGVRLVDKHRILCLH